MASDPTTVIEHLEAAEDICNLAAQSGPPNDQLDRKETADVHWSINQALRLLRGED